MNKDCLLKIENPRVRDAAEGLISEFSVDTMLWFARLWDAERGAFYYSNSARDYEGFLPDIESTVQGLNIVSNYGMVDKHGSLYDALPESVREKLVSFVRGMADPDGYFYHKQWGKNINLSRRGRDLSWSTTLLKNMRADSPYPTALERLSNGQDGEGLPTHLRSREALFEYMEGLDFPNKSYPAANMINAQMGQISAAGLIDDCCDWLDAHQDERTGLWQDGKNYTTVSGLMKVGSSYIRAKRTPKYYKAAVESAIEVALSNESHGAIVSIYNPLNAVSSIRSSLRLQGRVEEADAITKRLSDVSVEIIENTRRKMVMHKKTDCSFSYLKERSSHNSQAMPVAIPYTNEGDVNATTIAIHGVGLGALSALGYDLKIYDSADFDAWLDTLTSVQPKKKLPLPDGVRIENNKFV